ncbi:hypothetical protein MLD38_017660 [Melastoma candidum]|uniref:Uncharacterized protein n=1 Tax=Melastoma candidum TaxID=119954 RepID=A0ACB9QUU9_9MYRT|nr:hypothetical protein MLD38_017660 [Melastoma candidum]
MNVPFGASPAAYDDCAPPSENDPKIVMAKHLIAQLGRPELRGNALRELSELHKREVIKDMALLLRNSFGTIGVLLQEIVSIYRKLSGSPPTLCYAESSRVCHSLALLQCVASHPDTKQLFVDARISLYLHPFIDFESKTTSESQERAFEYLRLTSLGVIGALVKIDDSDVIRYLLETELMPLCLRAMVVGKELSKTVSTFIIQKILLDELGLAYMCATAERFFALVNALAQMVAALAESPSSRLLKNIIRCYLRLTDNPRGHDALSRCLPEMLKDGTFYACMLEEPVIWLWLQQLLGVLGVNQRSSYLPKLDMEKRLEGFEETWI